MKRTKLLGAGLALASSLLFIRPASAGTKHALLVGIGDYTSDEVTDLEGAANDAIALKKLLVDRWGFPAANVKTLLNRDATKVAILAALDELSTRTRPGDQVFIHFSGHGTSTHERTDLGIDNNTGALVPADAPRTGTDIAKHLIVGNRDLRPRLDKIDKDREVLVIFDSCYSGAAVRSARAKGKPRYLELPRPATRSLGSFPADDEGEFGSQTEKALPYPYESVIYLSAASRAESARDITREEIKLGEQETWDGLPHGALTNQLLRALSGDADSNRDGVLSYAELYGFVRNKVAEEFPQQPQLLAPETGKEALLSKAILGGVPAKTPSNAASPVPSTSVPPAPPALRVRLEGVAPDMAKRLAATPGVGIVQDRGYDILVTQEGGGYRFFHASGDLLASYSSGESAEVPERLKRQVSVRTLLDLKFPGQDFNVSVAIPGNRGFLRKGDVFAIDAAAEREAVMLLVNIDTSGHVSVLFPFNAGELPARRLVRVPPTPDDLRVSPPFGIEYLKVFAFAQKPPGIEAWMKESFPASDAKLDQLIDWLKKAPGSKAEDRLKLVTRDTTS